MAVCVSVGGANLSLRMLILQNCQHKLAPGWNPKPKFSIAPNDAHFNRKVLIYLLYLYENVCCGTQPLADMFSWRDEKNMWTPLLSGVMVLAFLFISRQHIILCYFVDI